MCLLTCFLEKLREKMWDKVRKECLKKMRLNLTVFNLYCDEIRAQKWDILKNSDEAELLMRAGLNDWAVECSAGSDLTAKARDRTWFFCEWQLRDWMSAGCWKYIVILHRQLSTEIIEAVWQFKTVICGFWCQTCYHLLWIGMRKASLRLPIQ